MQDNDTTEKLSRDAYVTLLTRPSYLAGAIILAYTLHKHSPHTPLIIAYTPETFPEGCRKALEAEARHSNVILCAVEHLRLPDDGGGKEHGMVAERFIDTWTKLRVFGLHDMKQNFDHLCWLDADMMVLSDPSPLIFNAENDAYVKGDDGLRLMAVHTCVCNLDHDSWAPESWIPENCALTHLASPSDVAPVSASPKTFSLFNSGTFLFRPSPALSSFINSRFEEMGVAHLRSLQFPDQDFLNEVFNARWKSLSWRTNALKTWRYWHTNIWRDDADVAVLHHIVDKPWAARVKSDGTAGYLGKDGATHQWWWDEFSNWKAEREAQGETELLDTVARYVAGESGSESEEMRAIGGGAQDYAKKWPSKSADEKKEAGEEVKKKRGNGVEPIDGAMLQDMILGVQEAGTEQQQRRGGGWSVMDA